MRHGSVALGGILAGAATLLAVVGALGERGIAVVHHCVAGGGSFAWWGTRLAMVRHSDVCPEGTLALGGAPDDVAGVIAAVTVPLLLLHAGLGLGGLGVGRHLGRCFRQVARLVRPVVSARPMLPVLPIRREAPRYEVIGLPPVRSLLLASAQVRRGPPLAVA